MGRLRILLLAPFCDPNGVSMPYVTYSHAAALGRLHEVDLVVGSPSASNVLRAQGPFRNVEVVRMPWVERINDWMMRKVFKYNYDTQVLTAFSYPTSLAFEWNAWRQVRAGIKEGKYDIVLRLLPMSPVIPSLFAYLLRKGPIPFVIGPLNGGLPWPAGFTQLENQKEWISNLRNVYRYLPFARSTYRDAAAIIAASSQTFSEFSAYADKLFFVPEPGIALSLCSDKARSTDASERLHLLFVGGLVPRKACDLALRAAAPVLRNHLAEFTVVGDGPERGRLESLANSLGIQHAVHFCGWLGHSEVLEKMRVADVFVFPTLRDNGAGVVFEALASGAVPVVADFGGPGDIVHPGVGYKVALTSEDDMVAQMEKILAELGRDRKLLQRLRESGVAYARERLTWEAKAEATTQVLDWVLQRAPKPQFVPPKALHLEYLN